MQKLSLPDQRHQHWRDALPGLLNKLRPGAINIDCGEWLLTCGELMPLSTTMEAMGCSLLEVNATNPETSEAQPLSAFPFGHRSMSAPTARTSTQSPELLFHQGMLR